jgi:hypothetical protein
MSPLPVAIGNWIPFFISATGDDFTPQSFTRLFCFVVFGCTHHSTSVSLLIYNSYNKRLSPMFAKQETALFMPM